MMKSDALKKLTHKQVRFLRFLIAEPKSVGDAARKAGIHENTATTWMRDPTFREALAEAEIDILQDIVRKLFAAAGKSLDKLDAILDDDTITVGNKLRAIDMTLTHVGKLFAITSQARQTADAQSQQQQQTGDDWIAAEDTGNDQAGDQTDQDSDDDSSTGTDSTP